MPMYCAHEQFGYFGREVNVFVDKRLSSMPYAQAGVIMDGWSIKLISYSTLVCTIDRDGWLTCTGTYSQTTRKHISAFMREYGEGHDYYTAKKCYTDDIAYNLYTGEIMPLSEYAKIAKD